MERLALCYHGVSAGWPEHTSVHPERLEQHVRTLLRSGFTPVTFTTLVSSPPRGKAVALTFDDAHESVWREAFPRLSALGAVASVFVPTDYPGRERPMAWEGIDRWVGTPHEAELRCMTWQQLSRLADARWEIGSHTASHPRLPGLDDTMLLRESRDSRRACEERLDRPCTSIAYPFGDYDERVVAAVREAGYATAATIPLKAVRPGMLEWPRSGVFRNDGPARFRVKTARSARALTPVWRPCCRPPGASRGRVSMGA